MLLYEIRRHHVKMEVIERRGSKSAFFPWQRDTHLVAVISVEGAEWREFRRLAVYDEITLMAAFTSFVAASIAKAILDDPSHFRLRTPIRDEVHA